MTPMLSLPTPKDRTIALVRKDIKGTEGFWGGCYYNYLLYSLNNNNNNNNNK